MFFNPHTPWIKVGGYVFDVLVDPLMGEEPWFEIERWRSTFVTSRVIRIWHFKIFFERIDEAKQQARREAFLRELMRKSEIG